MKAIKLHDCVSIIHAFYATFQVFFNFYSNLGRSHQYHDDNNTLSVQIIFYEMMSYQFLTKLHFILYLLLITVSIGRDCPLSVQESTNDVISIFSAFLLLSITRMTSHGLADTSFKVYKA